MCVSNVLVRCSWPSETKIAPPLAKLCDVATTSEMRHETRLETAFVALNMKAPPRCGWPRECGVGAE